MDLNKNKIEEIINEWFNFREETLTQLEPEDKKHLIDFDKHMENIMRNVPECNKKYVKKQFDSLDTNYFDYICYWNEKYYMNGFKDAMNLIFFGLGGD